MKGEDDTPKSLNMGTLHRLLVFQPYELDKDAVERWCASAGKYAKAVSHEGEGEVIPAMSE